MEYAGRWEAGNAKGYEHEKMMAQAFRELHLMGFIDGVSWVGRYNTPFHRELDSQGIDIIVIKGKLGLPIQIKSNDRNARRARQKHPSIPVIVLKRVNSQQAFTRAKALLRNTPPSLWEEKYFQLYQELTL